MKKLFAFFCLMFFASMSLFAQDPTAPPAGWGDVFSNPVLWFGSFAGISLLTAFLATFINGMAKITKKFHRQIVAWLIAIALLVVCDLVNWKLCYAWDFPWWLAALHGFAAGLASNGVFDIPLLKSFLDKVEGWFIKPEPTPPVE